MSKESDGHAVLEGYSQHDLGPIGQMLHSVGAMAHVIDGQNVPEGPLRKIMIDGQSGEAVHTHSLKGVSGNQLCKPRYLGSDEEGNDGWIVYSRADSNK